MKTQGGPRILRQLSTLPASVICKEGEAMAANALHQDHADTRTPVGSRGRQGSGIWIVELSSLRIFHPQIEQGDRIFTIDFVRNPHGHILSGAKTSESSRMKSLTQPVFAFNSPYTKPNDLAKFPIVHGNLSSKHHRLWSRGGDAPIGLFPKG
jgi:hypothetical protein